VSSRTKVTLRRKADQVFARVDEQTEEIPVKLVWERPVSGREHEISLIGPDKREIAMIWSLEELDPDSRLVAEEELSRRYLVPRITRVFRTEAQFGNRYWDVATDCGPKKFLMKDPHSNVTWISTDRLVIRDTLGNRYEIESLNRLDARSRAEVEKIL